MPAVTTIPSNTDTVLTEVPSGSLALRGPVGLFQAKLEDWTLMDPSGVVAGGGVVDGSGYTDITTTATSGAFYFATPIESFSGAPFDPTTLTMVGVQVRLITSTSFDRVLGGWSTAGDPTLPGSVFEMLGCRDRQDLGAGQLNAYITSELGPFAGATAAVGDRAVGSLSVFGGFSEFYNTAYIHNGTVRTTATRGHTLGTSRPISPTHLVVEVAQNAAFAQTMRIAVGFHVDRSLPSFDIVP